MTPTCWNVDHLFHLVVSICLLQVGVTREEQPHGGHLLAMFFSVSSCSVPKQDQRNSRWTGIFFYCCPVPGQCAGSKLLRSISKEARNTAKRCSGSQAVVAEMITPWRPHVPPCRQQVHLHDGGTPGRGHTSLFKLLSLHSHPRHPLTSPCALGRCIADVFLREARGYATPPAPPKFKRPPPPPPSQPDGTTAPSGRAAGVEPPAYSPPAKTGGAAP